MTENPAIDLTYFAISLLSGIMVGLLYDILRRIRSYLSACDFIINITDIVFLTSVSCLMAYEAYELNYGQLRVYSILSLIAMFFLYRLTVSKYAVLFIDKVILLFEKILSFAAMPIVSIGRAVKRVVGKANDKASER